jgi:hypothetical protein
MIPMRTSTIFKSRWMALLWAAGIIWFAYDNVGPEDPASNVTNAEQPTDIIGEPVTADDQKKLEQALNSF